MILRGGSYGSDPVRPEPVARLTQDQRGARSWRLATGTLACPVCDAPVAIAGCLSPTDRLGCPYCRHTAGVRDFLSLAAPARPARVEVRVIARAIG